MDKQKYLETLSACPLCGFTQNHPLFFEKIKLEHENHQLGINQCKSCRLCYVSPRLNRHGLTLLYNQGYSQDTVSGKYNVEADVSELEYAQFVEYLKQELPKGGKVLDVGCGVGLMLDSLAKNIPSLASEGVEFSSFAASKAIEKGHKIYVGDITEIEELQPETFDAIIILYVLEHVPDPIAVLKKCHTLLKKNGKIFVAVPNYRYLQVTHTGILSRLIYGKDTYIHAEEHLFNYTPVTLSKILDYSGFMVNYYGQAQPLRIGSPVQRLIKFIFSMVFDFLFLIGYQMGGIHVICTKK